MKHSSEHEMREIESLDLLEDTLRGRQLFCTDKQLAAREGRLVLGVDQLETQGSPTGANNRTKVSDTLTLEVLVRPLARVLVVNVVDHKFDPLDGLEAVVDLEALDKDWVQAVLDTLCGRVGLLGPLARVWVLEEHEDLWVTERDGILVLEFSRGYKESD